MKRLLDNATAGIEPPAEQPKLGSLDSLVLPGNMPVQVKPARETVLDSSESLDSLTDKALRKAEEILDMDLIPGDDDFASILKAQVSQVQTILTTQVRVDDGRLKKKQVDKIGELIEAIRAHEAKEVGVRVLN